MLPFFAGPNQAHRAFAVDVYLALCMDAGKVPAWASPSPKVLTACAEWLERFEAMCVTESWMRAAVCVLDTPAGARDSDPVHHDVSSLEKVSVILQKLSKRRWAFAAVPVHDLRQPQGPACGTQVAPAAGVMWRARCSAAAPRGVRRHQSLPRPEPAGHFACHAGVAPYRSNN